MAIRFNRKNEDNWRKMIPNRKSINKEYRKRNGRVMFPTSHDITKESLFNCLIVLKKLIDSENEVLITTKPRLNCVKIICNDFWKRKDFIQFRFTITSINDDLLKFWEPGAPLINERYESLKYAYEQGYKTSISIEPFLDIDPFNLVEKLIPYVTESIWIGKMNYITSKNISNHDRVFYDKIRKCVCKENLQNIIDTAINYDHIIRIKDSIHNFLFK